MERKNAFDGLLSEPTQPQKEPVSLQVSKHKPPKRIRELRGGKQKPLKLKFKEKKVTGGGGLKRTSKKLRKFSNDVGGITEEERENKEEGIFEGIIIKDFYKIINRTQHRDL